MPVSRGTVVECTATTLQKIGDRPWHSAVGIPASTVVRGAIGDAVGLHTYRISVFLVSSERCPRRFPPSSLTASLLCTHIGAYGGGFELLPPSLCVLPGRVGEDPSPSPRSDTDHSPRLVLLPPTMIAPLCFCVTLSMHPHNTLILHANKPCAPRLW